MKKTVYSTLLFVIFLVTIRFSYGQVRIVESTNNATAYSSPAFIDASSNIAINTDANLGKGLLFPRADLTLITTYSSTDYMVGRNTSFPTYFDGMIVYNTATGIAGIGGTSVTPGFYYYKNSSANVDGGIWVRLTEMTDAVTSAMNIAGGSAGSLLYQSGAGTTTSLAAGSDGQVLTLASGVPSWADAPATGITAVSGTENRIIATTTAGSVELSLPDNISGLTSVVATTFNGDLSGNATTATTATNIAGGAAGSLPYQSGAGTTAALAVGTEGQILTVNSAGVPSWQDAPSGGSLNVTAELTASYTATATDDIILFNVNTSGNTLTLPLSGVPIGKVYYISLIGGKSIELSPSPRDTGFSVLYSGYSYTIVCYGDGKYIVTSTGA